MKNCVLITGCSSGIGRAAAFHFLNEGWQVVATMRSPEKEVELNSYSDVLVEYLDVTSKDSIISAVDNALTNFEKIDVLVNNAGIGEFIVFEEADESIVRQTFETNILGLMWVTKVLLPEFRKNRQGTIINVTSTMPHVGLPLATLYCATKMAIEGFSNALYYELKPFGINVRLVQPGSTRTDVSMQHKCPGEPQIQDYSSTCKKVARLISHRHEAGTVAAPEEVAKVIYQAAISEGPRYRYVSGRDAKMFNLIRRLLPDHTLKNMAGRMAGLDKPLHQEVA
jgi:NAD(P)-dependent dehydrogenase (short-subunit alcohol dehydrogenase family)